MSNPEPDPHEQIPRKKIEFVKPVDEPLPSTLTNQQWTVIFIVGFLVIVGIGYKLFSRHEIKLLSPLNNSKLDADNLEFSWQCDKQISFVVEVYEGGDIVMRSITDKPFFKPDINQKKVLETDHTYRWLVIPNPDVEQKYSFKSEQHVFAITKAIEVPPEPVATPTPAPPALEPSPSPTPQPVAPRPMDPRIYRE